MHQLHQPDQCHNLHQLQGKPQQEIQPHHLAEARVGQHPLQLLQRWFLVGRGTLCLFCIGGQPPAADQSGHRRNGSGNPTHHHIATTTIGEHQGGHDQSAQPSQDRSGETCSVQTRTRGGVLGQFGGESCVGQVHAGVGRHQQHRHHHVINGLLPHISGGYPPHRRQADAEGQSTAEHPGQPGAPAALGVVAEPADQRVVEAIPHFDHRQQRAGDEGR